MNELLSQISLFGLLITIGAFLVGQRLHGYIKISVLSPFLIAVVLIILFLVLFGVEYETYEYGAASLTYFLTPATVCLAIPLYKNVPLLKRHWMGILTGITVGVLTNAVCIWGLSALFQLDHTQYVTILPKSVTTAICIGLSSELGGIVTMSIGACIISGVTGNVFAPLVCRLFRIRHPLARGVAIGTASHAIGTARAVEMGETEGAMSGLSIALTGLITVAVVPLFALFL